MERMSASDCLNSAHYGQAEQGKIAHNIQNLMANELVAKTQPILVQGPIFRQDYRVFQIPTTYKSRFAQFFDIFGKTKRPRRSHFSRIIPVSVIEQTRLLP